MVAQLWSGILIERLRLNGSKFGVLLKEAVGCLGIVDVSNRVLREVERLQ